MDPNAALKEIREIVEHFDEYTDPDQTADRLVELVDGLDQWLSRGGALPALWTKGR